MSDIEDVLNEEQDAFDNLPEGLQVSDRGADMEDYIASLEDVISNLEDAQEQIDTAISTAIKDYMFVSSNINMYQADEIFTMRKRK